MMPLADYLSTAHQQSRLLAFASLAAFTSSAGQTFFIGVFGPEIRATFTLSHTEWGSIYLVGTLATYWFIERTLSIMTA